MEASNKTLVEVGSENGGVLDSEICVKDDDMGGGVKRGSDIIGVDEEMKSGVEEIEGENDSGGLVLHSVFVLDENVGVKESRDDGSSKKCKGEGLRGKGSEYRSLLKEMDENGVENDESDNDDIGDESCEYRVGDFVWGKIKSYPWWPGQIYDASDASEYALKLKQKDRFLVAYFGDGSFSWCGPSQLKPFVENFKVMSEQTNSKNFMYAVEAALDEVSRAVELDMTCSCLAEKNGKLEAGMASNSGLKVGVLVPVGVGKSFIAQCEPQKLMDSLRNFAETVSMKNLLELTVIKSWLTAYCRTKGGYPLPLYHYPRGIEGLEDKSGNPAQISVQGTNGEEWLSVPVEAVSYGLDLPNQSLLQKCQEISGDVLYQRRKQKSVAELIEDEMKKEESFVKKSISNEVSTGKRKRKDGNEAEKQDNTQNALQSGLRRGRRQKAVASLSRRTVGEKFSTGESNDFEGKEADEHPPSGELQDKILSGGESEGEEWTAKSNRLRERKRSKYLSPPFTNPSQIMKVSSFKRDSETESVKKSRVGERMARVAGQLIGLQSTSNETYQTEPRMETGNNNAISGSSSPKTALQDHSKTDISMHFTASPIQLLSQLQSAAADPSCLIEKSEVDFITKNVTSFRHTILNEVQQKGEPGRMKRKPEYMSHLIGNGCNAHELEIPPAKKAANASETKTNKEDERNSTPVALILTFPPAYSLPSKNELMKIYGKFGPMNEKETDVLYNSYCARVSYLRSSDGEEAYRASVEKNPFGAANVNYRLRYLSATVKASESNQIFSIDNAKATQPSDDEATQLGFVREKLKMLTSMLENCGGRISVEIKSKLESEVKVLLEEVSSMTVTSP